jgi:hypothetical protein
VAVQLYDRSPEQVSKGLTLMNKLLAKDVAKGKIQEEDARHARERVSVIDQTTGVRGMRDVDMVIEVRRQADFLVAAPLNVRTRPLQRILRSSSAYLRSWQLRRGPTPSWPLIHLLFLSLKLPLLLCHRASLLRRRWARAAQGELLVRFMRFT